MILEHLPNEILFLIFDYLWYHEMIYAFHQLNNRFNILLLSYSCYSFDVCHPISKLDFCLNKQLLSDVSAIRSLKFPIGWKSMLIRDLFFSHYPLELFYSNLQSLSLHQFNGEESVNIFLSLANFQQLKWLSVNPGEKLYVKWSSEIREQICDTILFQIKTLKYLSWNTGVSLLDEISATRLVKRSTIEHYIFDFLNGKQFEWLDFHTLNLKSIDFSYQYPMNATFENKDSIQLVCLKLQNISSKIHFENMLNNCGNLSQLKHLQVQGEFCLASKPIDGYQLQTFIINYFPQLNIFKFFFKMTQLGQIDELVQSYMTDFWIKEKKWFVNFDCRALPYTTYLYTIPCISTHLEYSSSWKQITTKISNDTRNIHNLTLSSIPSQQTSSYSRFTNVQTLVLMNVENNLIFDQLNRLINLFSLQHIYFQSKIGSHLFFDLLKHINQRISITIEHASLEYILGNINETNINYLKKIKSLHVKKVQWYYSFFDKQLKNISLYFLHVKELIVEELLLMSHVIYLLNNLNNLSYLKVSFNNQEKLSQMKIQQLLITNQNKQSKRDIICVLDILDLQVFLSNPVLSDKNTQCNLI